QAVSTAATAVIASLTNARPLIGSPCAGRIRCLIGKMAACHRGQGRASGGPRPGRRLERALEGSPLGIAFALPARRAGTKLSRVRGDPAILAAGVLLGSGEAR